MCCGEDLHLAAFSPFAVPQSDLVCQPCRLAPPPFARAVAYAGYDGVLRELIHALKYEGIVPIADRLGDCLATAIVQLSDDSSDEVSLENMLVVPVPLHPVKERQRGFNQAELLARAAIRHLRRRCGWRVSIAVGLLARRKATESQAGLSPHQRRANLRGVFFAPCPERVKGRHLLLIDDVYTTGSTARACSQVLRRAGALSVRVATVARPQRENLIAPRMIETETPMHEDVAFWGRPAVPPVTAANQPQTTFWGRDVLG